MKRVVLFWLNVFFSMSKLPKMNLLLHLFKDDKVVQIHKTDTKINYVFQEFFTKCARYSTGNKNIYKTIHVMDDGRGYQMRLNVNEFTQCGYYFGNSNPDLYKVIQSFSKGIFIDIGANVGYFSLLGSSHFDKVLAFEPAPDTFSDLNHNIALSKVGNIKPFAVALSEKLGTMSLFVNPLNRGGSSLNGFDHSVEEAFFRKGGIIKHDVIVETLDNIVKLENLNTPIALIKIDVEGHEEQVIKGAYQTLSRYSPVLFVEITTSEQFLRVRDLLPSHYKAYKPDLSEEIIFNSKKTWAFSDVVFSTHELNI